MAIAYDSELEHERDCFIDLIYSLRRKMQYEEKPLGGGGGGMGARKELQRLRLSLKCNMTKNHWG